MTDHSTLLLLSEGTVLYSTFQWKSHDDEKSGSRRTNQSDMRAETDQGQTTSD